MNLPYFASPQLVEHGLQQEHLLAQFWLTQPYHQVLEIEASPLGATATLIVIHSIKLAARLMALLEPPRDLMDNQLFVACERQGVDQCLRTGLVRSALALYPLRQKQAICLRQPGHERPGLRTAPQVLCGRIAPGHTFIKAEADFLPLLLPPQLQLPRQGLRTTDAVHVGPGRRPSPS